MIRRAGRQKIPDRSKNATERMRQADGEHNAECPWCNTPIKKPAAVFSCLQTEFHGGYCQCGALFLVDPSGKNMGQVLMDLLSIVFPTRTIDTFPNYTMEQYLYRPEMHTMRASDEMGRIRSAKLLFVKPQNAP